MLLLRPLVIACIAAAFVAVPTSAAAATPCTSVAAPDGSDANPGTETAPFRTPQRLIDYLQPGDTGCLRGGTYTDRHEGYIAHFDRAGTAERPISLRSFPGERARLRGITIVRTGADHVRLSALNFEGTGEMNAIKIYAKQTVIEDSDITNEHASNSCMILGSPSTSAAEDVTIRRNVLRACGNPANGNKDHAIYASRVEGGEIVDNVIVDPAAWAIQLYPNAHDTTFAHNVIDGGKAIRGGVVFGGDTGAASSDNVVEANVITHTATWGVTVAWGGATGSGNLARKNCIHDARAGAVVSGPGLTAVDNMTADPGFIDPEHLDYRLTPDSPCLAAVGYDTAAKVRAAQEALGTPPSDSGEVDAKAFFASGGDPVLGNFPEVELTIDKAAFFRRGGLLLRRLKVRADVEGKVVKVLFLVDNKVQATDYAKPFNAILNGVRGRARNVTARAYNRAGRAATVTVRIPRQ